MNRWATLLANIVLFDVLWTLAVYGAGRPWWWAAPVLILASAGAQLRWSPAPAAESLVIFGGAVGGVLLDIAANSLGLFRYASPSRVEFVIVFYSLWINFGTTLRPSLRWVWGRWAAAALLGGAGGLVAYWTAGRIGAIAPVEPAWRAFAWCGVQFAVAVPLWCAAASFVFTRACRSDRPGTLNASPRPPDTPAM